MPREKRCGHKYLNVLHSLHEIKSSHVVGIFILAQAKRLYAV